MPQFTLQPSKITVQHFIEDLGDGVELDMVLVPGGIFLMGSPEDELERSNDEALHEVNVPNFIMGRYPITQAQWRSVARLEPVERELEADPSNFEGDGRPVEQVSWEDATEFCQRLSNHTGRDYRLPSEAEWEYACRAGKSTPFYYGKTLTSKLANYHCSNTYDNGPAGEPIGETSPVGQFPANAFGLSDMHGNVYEWCQDHYHGSYEDAPVDGNAWGDENPEEDQLRILRGGSWITSPYHCRSAFRNWCGPGDRLNSVGFRVICVAPRT